MSNGFSFFICPLITHNNDTYLFHLLTMGYTIFLPLLKILIVFFWLMTGEAYVTLQLRLLRFLIMLFHKNESTFFLKMFF